MTTDHITIPAPASSVRRRTPGTSRASFAWLATIPVTLLAGSSAPSPLYPLYQREWHFSSLTVTAVFGVYALAVLSALLVLGSLSDHVGRRPVLLLALAAQVVAMIIFATAGNVPALFAGRIVQGLSTGAAMAAVGAGLLDLHRARGALINSAAPAIGTAVGALGSGLLVRYLPAPAHVVYLVLAGLFVAQAIGVASISETAERRPGGLASLRPSLAVPPPVRTTFGLAVPALVAAWALAGFYLALGPALVPLVAGSHSPLLAGLAIFALAGSGALTVLISQKSPSHAEMLTGVLTLAAGVAVTLVAISLPSLAVFFGGTVLAGVGFGAAFHAGVRTVSLPARPDQRSGLMSAVYVVSYLALGIPVVIGGLLVDHGDSVLATAREYGAGVIALALLAMVGTVRSRWHLRVDSPQT